MTGPGSLLAVRAARVAGLCYLVVIGLGVAQAAFVTSALVVPGDPAATVTNIADHGLLFRLGVLGDVFLYALVLVLSVALYVVLREVHRPLALGALLLRSAEGVVGLVVTVLGGLLPLLLLSDPVRADASTIAAFVELRGSAIDVVLILIGLGGATFCHLFFRSRLVPGGLALWGVLTYLSMIILGAGRILRPDLPHVVPTLLYVQGALFEVSFGLWLLLKAVDVSAYEATEKAAA